MKSKHTAHPSLERLFSALRRFYPLPDALVGYLFGSFAAALSIDSPAVPYAPLPLNEAIIEALSAELPFWIAAALLVLIRPVVSAGRLLIFLKAACYGFGAEMLLPAAYPSFGYFRYVCISLLLTALYACPIRYAADTFGGNLQNPSKLTFGDYWVRWLFYAGSAVLLLPLKYFIGF